MVVHFGEKHTMKTFMTIEKENNQDYISALEQYVSDGWKIESCGRISVDKGYRAWWAILSHD